MCTSILKVILCEVHSWLTCNVTTRLCVTKHCWLTRNSSNIVMEQKPLSSELFGSCMSLAAVCIKLKNQTQWPESASELYRPSDLRLSVKLVPTFADIRCHVVSVTDPYNHIFGFLERSRYFFFQVAPQLYSRSWVDLAPDPLLLRKSDSAGNRPQLPHRNSNPRTSDLKHSASSYCATACRPRIPQQHKANTDEAGLRNATISVRYISRVPNIRH
jgi:hypothetical protein